MTNKDYWKPKLYGNRKRDEKHAKKLSDNEWNVLTVWECELKPDKIENTLSSLKHKLESFI